MNDNVSQFPVGRGQVEDPTADIAREGARLLHHAVVVPIAGSSYRLRRHADAGGREKRRGNESTPLDGHQAFPNRE